MESLRLPPKSVFLPCLHWQEGAMRHNSGRLLGNKRRSHHPGDSYAGVFICVSNSILLVCVTISTLFLFHECLMYHLIFYIHSPHFYLQTSSLHSPYSIDGQSTHLSIDRVPSSPSLLLTSLHPRTVDWWNERRWHTRISAMCYCWTDININQTTLHTRPDLCSINLILILWQVIHCHHPLHMSDGNIRSGTHINRLYYEVSYPVGGHYQ